MNNVRTRLGTMQIVIILLTLATAGIHLSLVFPSVMFILNGLGYLALLAAFFLPIPLFTKNHNLVRWAFIAYTLVTIIAWVFIGSKTPLGFTAKAIEVVLVVLLWLDRKS